jgi:hypothetical protein
MKYRVATILLIAICLCFRVASAAGGPCGTEIASFRRTLQQLEILNPRAVGSARQTIDAQLEHQPTPMSVELAEKNAKAEIAAVLAQAERLDSQGRQDECRSALDTARLLLDP